MREMDWDRDREIKDRQGMCWDQDRDIGDDRGRDERVQRQYVRE